jgi:hypothetical protein
MVNRWHGEDDGETWKVHIEGDAFTPDAMVVVLDTQHHDGTDDHTTLVTATPEQAREMAAALTFFADYVEKVNANPRNRG